MKQKLFLLAILLMAMAIPQSVKAYDFSAVAPSGQMLYYSYNNGSSGNSVTVTSQNSSDPYYSTCPTGALTIPSSVTHNGTTYSVTSIGYAAFYNCGGLTSVSIPNTVTTIGTIAFRGCSGMTSVTIPNSVTTIGNSAFWNCSGLTSVTIPNSVTTIYQWAFQGCSGLTSVTIPNSVTTIGREAFSLCTNITSVTIPNSVTTIGQEVFARCIALTSIEVDSGNNVYDSRGNCNHRDFHKHADSRL